MLIKRIKIESIKHWLKKEKILVLKGSRQVGKTTILRELEKEIKKKYPKTKVVYLSADDFENENIFQSSSSLELYLEQNYNFPEKYIFLMIDEFQNIKQAGLFLKNIFDKYKKQMQIIVSGSSSLEITKNTEFLTGRAIDFEIKGINFKEFFDFKNKIKTKKITLNNFEQLELFYQTYQNKLELNLQEYFVFGSYPEVITTKNIVDKKIILKSIIKTYLEKDIINFLKIENVSGFNNLIKILANQIGNQINISEISRATNVALNTTKKYLDILIGTYIFNLATPFYKNLRKEISKMPKIFIRDFGIKNYLLRTFEFENLGDLGALAENFVYLDLLDKAERNYIHYYRTKTGAEIDFVLEKDNGKVVLLEVKYRNKMQQIKAFDNFSEKYSQDIDKRIVVTKNLLRKNSDIYYIPLVLLPFIEGI